MTNYMHQYRKSQRPPKRDTGSTPQRGDVWWASNIDGVKDRPIVVLSSGSNSVTYRRCTSQDSCFRSRDLIEDYDVAGLDRPTYLDPMPCTIDRSRLVRRLGTLSQYDRDKFRI